MTIDIAQEGVFALGAALLIDSDTPKFFLDGKQIEFNKCPYPRYTELAYIRRCKIHFMRTIFSRSNIDIFRNFIKWSNGIDNLLEQHVNIVYDQEKDVFAIHYMDQRGFSYAVEFNITDRGSIKIVSCQCEDDHLICI